MSATRQQRSFAVSAGAVGGPEPIEEVSAHPSTLCSSNSVVVAAGGRLNQGCATHGLSQTRPSQVEWSPELINTVYLLGRTGGDFEMKYLANAQVLGTVPLAITNTKNDTMWVNLEIWGPLAESAAATVRGNKQSGSVGPLTPYPPLLPKTCSLAPPLQTVLLTWLCRWARASRLPSRAGYGSRHTQTNPA